MPYPVREPNFEALRVELGRHRAARDWTYDELAERSGVSRRTLIAMETGTTHGRLESWFRIAQAFDLDLGELLRKL
ncbi:MAG: helix-turn-helix transcriptional regulator [Protaetiibacter sp.]